MSTLGVAASSFSHRRLRFLLDNNLRSERYLDVHRDVFPASASKLERRAKDSALVGRISKGEGKTGIYKWDDRETLSLPIGIGIARHTGSTAVHIIADKRMGELNANVVSDLEETNDNQS